MTSQIQAIDSHYYNITDGESHPVAGLLVLLDGNGQPVRAELHLYERLPSHIQELAVRQSRAVVQERYSGGEPLPLRIHQTSQIRDAMDIRLPTTAIRTEERRQINWTAWSVGAGIVLLMLLVGWAAIAWYGLGPSGVNVSDVDTGSSEASGLPGDGEDASATAQIEVVQDITPTLTLPASQFARDDIAIGARVQIVPGLQLWLRSQPGASAGEEVGYMADGAEATVVDGPVYLQGDTDTIVWWLVRLDDETEGWAAANTSQQTLLVPVP